MRPLKAPKVKAISIGWLQSRGGSLRLPLFQNGACPFPCTPLLSILMLVTHTWREIVLMLPRFRIVAVSMERLQIAGARSAAVTIKMIHLDPVVMWEEQPAVATAPVLRFEPLGHARTGARMPALADTPVHPVAIVRTTVARDLHVPGTHHLLMRGEIDGLRADGRRRQGPTGADPMPIPLKSPAHGLGRVSSVRPAAELDPGEMVEPCIDGLTHPDAVIVRPAPDFGVELIDHLTLGQRL